MLEVGQLAVGVLGFAALLVYSGLVVIGVSTEEEKALESFASRESLPFTLARDPQGKFQLHYWAQATPTFVVIDRDGKRYVEFGKEVTLVWGEPNGGTSKPTVEPHVQTEIKAIVSPVPYSQVARNSYADSWRQTGVGANKLVDAAFVMWEEQILAQDLRYTLRTLGRSPAFAITAILLSAIGIGATTAAVAVADHVLLRPLPYAEPDRLVHDPGVVQTGDDHDRDAGKGRAQQNQSFEAGGAGQGEIEQNDLDSGFASKDIAGGLDVAGFEDLGVGESELDRAAKRLAEHRVVVNDQKSGHFSRRPVMAAPDRGKAQKILMPQSSNSIRSIAAC